MKDYYLRCTLFLCFAGAVSGLFAQTNTSDFIQFELNTEPGAGVFIDGDYQGVSNGNGSIWVSVDSEKEHIQLRVDHSEFKSYERTIPMQRIMASGSIFVPLTTVNQSISGFSETYLIVLSGLVLIVLAYVAGKQILPDLQTRFSKNSVRPNRPANKQQKASPLNVASSPTPVRDNKLREEKSESFTNQRNQKENGISSGESFDKYRIVSKIAEGGVAIIYEAMDKEDQRLALKVMNQYLHDEDMVNKFIGEGWALQQIRKKFTESPVIHVFDYGRKNGYQDGVPFIAMELVEGKSLEFFIQNNVLGYDQKIDLLRQLAYAIDTAHQCQVLHRDLSPDNILIKDSSELEIRLIDFGVARHEVHWLKGTSVGAAFGKPEYMAPEQIEGGELDHTVDYYSMGVLMYALFVGRPPFTNEVMYKVFDLHINSDLPDMPETVPSHIQELIYSLMEKDPKKRPQSIDQIMEKLA